MIQMRFNQLRQILKEHNVPEDVLLLDDSGWECGVIQMNGVFHNRKLNVIVFSREVNEDEDYAFEADWETLTPPNKKSTNKEKQIENLIYDRMWKVHQKDEK